jgi:hypothetical protein
MAGCGVESTSSSTRSGIYAQMTKDSVPSDEAASGTKGNDSNRFVYIRMRLFRAEIGLQMPGVAADRFPNGIKGLQMVLPG